MVRTALALYAKPLPSGRPKRALSPSYLLCPPGITKAKPFLRPQILKAQKQRHRHVTAMMAGRLSNTME